ncbi:MAG TPA: DUF72 domain-containing protein [Actinomycetota bacterium]|nr:DUF72 domain-containing protein [Actinomycetota bacterium]
MGDFFVGTSGFASPAMRGGVPAQSAAATDLLAGYATRFGAVELDSVFYRSPSSATVDGWSDATHEAFRVVVRAPRDLTHVDRLSAPARAAQFVESLRALGPRLGAILFTTPPTFGCDVDRVRAVLDALGGVRTAWEFRHPSWLCPEVLELLAERNSAPVIVESFDGTSTGGLLPGGALADRWEFPFVYVRFRRESYTYADLVVWGDMLGDVIGCGQDVYAFFRQSPEATSYAMALSELLDEARAATFSTPVFSPSVPQPTP